VTVLFELFVCLCHGRGDENASYVAGSNYARNAVAVPESMTSPNTRLEANFTKASLIVRETRIVAGLLLDGVDAHLWKQQIEDENVLQKRTVNTARSYATIARHRLECCDAELWAIVRNADNAVATQAVLVAALTFSPLLSLFMRTALADEYRRMSRGLEDHVWVSFVSDQSLNHPNLAAASSGTQTKLRQNAYRILTEAGYLGHARNRPLQHVRVASEVLNYLDSRNESQILAAMECAQ
jgi:hypothetical protein